MKNYSVKEIAELLDTNPETVRRWIRSGKLKASQTSRKDGNTVCEDELYKYLHSTSKYAGTAAAMLSANSVLALTTAIGASVVEIIAKAISATTAKNDSEVRALSEDVRKSLKKNIIESERAIEKKKSAIADLQAEIGKEQRQIDDCRIALEHLSDAIDKVRNPKQKEAID